MALDRDWKFRNIIIWMAARHCGAPGSRRAQGNPGQGCRQHTRFQAQCRDAHAAEIPRTVEPFVGIRRQCGSPARRAGLLTGTRGFAPQVSEARIPQVTQRLAEQRNRLFEQRSAWTLG
jgi:hypothetical protein